MQQHRILSLLSILVMLIIPVIGWFLIAQPQLAAAASADQQRQDVAAQVAASQLVVDKLKADSVKLPEMRKELDELRGSIPAGVDPSGWIDGLSALATISGVQITALTVSDPLAYSPAQAPNAAPATQSPAEGEDGEDTAAQAPPEFPGIVTSPLITSSNFVAIPVTVDVKGPADAILRFVNGLQTDNRLYLVNQFSTAADADDPAQLAGKIGGYIWAIPTGEPGNPHPVSTIVKSMTPATPVVPDEDAEGADEESDDASPDPSSTPAP
jgi:hypothetical protein